MVAAIFEAPLTREQADELARLMAEGRSARPAVVRTAMLVYEDGIARIVAVWPSKDALDRYLSVTAVPRGTELMRAVGAEPTFSVVEVLELG
jgi:hypothetical protein